MNRFSASDAALEGFRLTRERPGTVLAWSGLYFVGILVIALVMMASLDPHFIDLAKKGPQALLARDPEQIGAMLASSLPAFLLIVVLTVALFSVVMSGIYRLVLRPAEHGFAHLRFGRDELRLIAVNLLLFAAGMACLTFGFAVTAMADNASPVAGVVVGIAVFAATVWLGVRLSLATPMSFATHRLAIAPAWRLSHGHFWPLLGMIVLAIVFYLIVWVLVTIIGVTIIAVGGGEQAVQAPQGPVAFVGFVAILAIQLLLPILQVIMVYSPLAVAYQQLIAAAPAAPPAAQASPG